MKRVYFIGIGGTAMGNVAIALKSQGYDVFGSDEAVYDPMLSHLREAGISWHTGYSEEHISPYAEDLIVVGNAVSRGNPEVEFALQHKCQQYSLAELISELIIKRRMSFVVTGTHGKTTTSSMLAWILECAAFSPDFMIGAVPANFASGCRVSATSEHVVLEGDEYDSAYFDKRSKFIHYKPDIACVNHIEFDHADIFRDATDVRRTFEHFVKLIPQDGFLFFNGDVEVAREVCTVPWCTSISVGTQSHNDVKITQVHVEAGIQHVTFVYEEQECVFAMSMVGEHNARNAVMACCMALSAGADKQTVLEAMLTFRAPKRRMEVLAETTHCVFVDDFAHHPTAIRETLKAARTQFPGYHIIALFEPRSNTSTRSIMQREFTEALAGADALMIGSVNRPERYTDADRMDVPAMVRHISSKGKQVLQLDTADANQLEQQVVTFIQQHASEKTLILTLSNGNVYGLRPRIVELVQSL